MTAELNLSLFLYSPALQHLSHNVFNYLWMTVATPADSLQAINSGRETRATPPLVQMKTVERRTAELINTIIVFPPLRHKKKKNNWIKPTSNSHQNNFGWNKLRILFSTMTTFLLVEFLVGLFPLLLDAE